MGDKSKCEARSRACTATEGRVGKVCRSGESNRTVCKSDGLNGRGMKSLDFIPFFYACRKARLRINERAVA